MNEEVRATCGTTPWWTGFHLGVSHWTQPDANANGALRFLTLNKVGEIGPATTSVSWNLELGLSEKYHDAQTRLFGNGYEIRAEDGSTLSGYVPAPGVFLIQGPHDMDAQLFCAEVDISTDEAEQAQQWIELEGQWVHLTRRTGDDQQEHAQVFCLQLTELDPAAAVQRAEGYFDIDVPAEIDREYQQRLSFFERNGRQSSTPAMALAFETLVSHLQPGGETFPTRWLCDHLESDPYLSTQHLYASIGAWNLVDVEISKELIRSLLKTQQNHGGIHAQFDPQQPPKEFLGMWPMLAQCCRQIWDLSEEHPDTPVDTAFFSEVLPVIEEHLQFSLEYFSIEASGYHGWQHPDEALVPEIYDANLVSVPLTSMLLCEIEELSYFSSVIPDFRPDTGLLNEERKRLARNLSEAWNEKAHAYTNYYLNGEPVNRVSIGSYFPMRWSGVDPSLATEIEKQLKGSETLLTPDGMTLWQRWETDDIDPPVEALHQVFIQPILNRSGLIDQQGAFMQGVHDAQEAWLKSGAGLVPDLSLNRNEFGDVQALPPSSCQQDLGAACLYMISQVKSQALDVNISDYPWLIRWLERHRQTVTLAASLFLFISVIAVAYGFAQGRKMGLRGEYTKQGIARNSYKIGRYEDAIARYTELLEISRKPSVKGDYQFMLANAYYKVDDLEKAETYYRASMENSGAKVPQPQWNLTQVLYRRGKYLEAKANLEAWLEKFAEHYPELEQRAVVVIDLIDQQIQRMPREREDANI